MFSKSRKARDGDCSKIFRVFLTSVFSSSDKQKGGLFWLGVDLQLLPIFFPCSHCKRQVVLEFFLRLGRLPGEVFLVLCLRALGPCAGLRVCLGSKGRP